MTDKNEVYKKKARIILDIQQKKTTNNKWG